MNESGDFWGGEVRYEFSESNELEDGGVDDREFNELDSSLRSVISAKVDSVDLLDFVLFIAFVVILGFDGVMKSVIESFG